jgi:hypothetical protein
LIHPYQKEKEKIDRKTALQIESPPERKSVYAPNKQDTEREGKGERRNSSREKREIRKKEIH